MNSNLRIALPGLMACALLACGGSTHVQGHVTDGLGTQQQGLGGTGGSFGGSGTVSSTTQVKVSAIASDGSLQALATASVKSDASYAVDVASGSKVMIVQGMDASGNVTVAGIVEASGSGGTVTVMPLDVETSVEAQVLTEMLVEGHALGEINTIDLRLRIDASIADAVRASSDAAAKIQALATGIAAAEESEAQAYSQLGVSLSAGAAFDAELAAAQALNVSLDSGAAAEASYAVFFTTFDAALEAKGLDAVKRHRVERAAGAAFRIAVKAQLEGSGSATDAVADAAIRGAAWLEGRAAVAAVNVAVGAQESASAAATAAASAGATLETQLAAAGTSADAAAAFAAYSAALAGTTDVSGSVLGTMVSVDVTTHAALQAVVDATATASTALNTSLGAAYSASVTAGASLSASAVSGPVAAAYAAFDASVEAEGIALTALGGASSVDLLLVADGSFQFR